MQDKPLTEQLAAAEETVKAIKEKIAAQATKNIFDIVKNFDDIIKLSNPSTEEFNLINYEGNNDIILCAKNAATIALIAKALNQGNKHNIWFPVFKTTGSGFVFSLSCNSCNIDFTAVGSALRFKDKATSDFAAKTFPTQFKNFLISKQ